MSALMWATCYLLGGLAFAELGKAALKVMRDEDMEPLVYLCFIALWPFLIVIMLLLPRKRDE